jgi:hypothetical protein
MALLALTERIQTGFKKRKRSVFMNYVFENDKNLIGYPPERLFTADFLSLVNDVTY